MTEEEELAKALRQIEEMENQEALLKQEEKPESVETMLE